MCVCVGVGGWVGVSISGTGFFFIPSVDVEVELIDKTLGIRTKDEIIAGYDRACTQTATTI